MIVVKNLRGARETMLCSQAQRHLEAELGWESRPPPFKFNYFPPKSPSLLVVMAIRGLEDAF